MSLRRLLIGLISLSSPMAAFGQQSSVVELPPARNRYAILIGVDAYDNKNIDSLGDPSHDVEILRDTLEKYAGFRDDHVIVLSTKSKESDRPTRNRILVALSSMKYDLREDSLLLFMFSGHGISKDKQAFLLPQDAVNTDDPKLLAQTSLSVDLIRESIADTNAKQAIVLLDSCRNDPEKGKGLSDNPLTSAYTEGFDFQKLNKNISASVVIYAADIGGRAYVNSNTNLGYFSEALVNALQGKAANQVGEVKLSSLLDYLQNAVPTMVGHDMPGKSQRPMYVVGGYKATDLILSHTLMSVEIHTGGGKGGTSVEANSTGNSNSGKIDPHKPLSLQAATFDFATLFADYRGDEVALANLGEAAFLRGNYDWTIKFLEQARLVQTSKVWMNEYPYLAAAYLLGPNDSQKFAATLEEMLRQMEVPNTYLHRGVTIGFAMEKLNNVRRSVPVQYRRVVDTTIERAQALASTIDGPKVGYQGHAKLHDCWLDGQECGFQFSTGSVVPQYPISPDVPVSDVVLMNQTNQTVTPTNNPAMLFASNDSPPYTGGGLVGGRAGIIAMEGESKLDDIHEAPAEGYQPHWFAVRVGGVYCIRTRDGMHYAKILVTSLTNKTIEFVWAYQPDGSRRFAEEVSETWFSGRIVPGPGKGELIAILVEGENGEVAPDELGRFKVLVHKKEGTRVRVAVYRDRKQVYDNFAVLPGPATLVTHKPK
jgi:hypothetical protein